MRMLRIAALLSTLTLTAGCAVATTGGGSAPAPSPTPSSARQPTTAKVDPAVAERLQRIMIPLLKVMNRPLAPGQVKVAIVDDPNINAGNAGSGQFLVTTGLLNRANDQQLRAVMAHEIAHEDLGHVAKAQTLGAGLNIGMIILDQIIPGSGAITPLAGELVMRKYGRTEEYAADRHGADLLQRSGYPREEMISTLSWLMQVSGGGGGGFFSTHPGTADRIEALRNGR